MMIKSENMISPNEQQVAEAIDWLVRLESGEMSDKDRQAFDHWKEKNPQNLVAWQRLAKANHHFTSPLKACDLKAEHMLNSFDHTDQSLREKRRTLKTFIALSAFGVGLWATRHHTGISQTGRHLYGKSIADLTTSTGEQKSVNLPDGSELILNTQSALDIDFDQRPQLQLHYGELAIKNSGQAHVGFADHVFTPAHKSEFTLIKIDDQCQINMINGKGECVISKSNRVVVESGQRLVIYPDASFAYSALDDNSLSWRMGLLIAEQMPLRHFIAQLSRYHPGYLGFSDNIVDLTLSGSFPLADTSAILDNLVQILPIVQRRFGRRWVYLMPS